MRAPGGTGTLLAFAPLAAALLVAGCDERRAAPGQGAGRALPSPAPSARAPGKTPAETTAAFVKAWLAAENAHDAAAAAALWATDASQQLAGNDPDTGRAAIQKDLEGTFERYKDAKLAVGRVWVGDAASVVEYVFSGTRGAGEMGGLKVGARRVGLPGALVLRFDADGLVKTEHQYFDLAANYGQVEPKLLPAGFDKVRAPLSAPPAGTDVFETKGTPVESKNLDTMNKLYGALDARALDDAMALVADDFVLEDFTTPGPQHKADFRKHATAVFAAMPDCKLSRATVFAAGDDVVVESSVAGTFTAAMGPVQPTGKPVLVHQLDVWRVKDGKVVRQWSYSNDVEVLTQLGVMKPPAPAAAAPSPSAAPAASAPAPAGSAAAP